MRVLLLTPLYIPRVGGLEILVRQLADELGARGHDVAIVTSHGGEVSAGLDHVDGVPVQRVDAHDVVEARDAAGILRVQRDIARFAREFAPEVVHSHDAGPVLWMYHRAARRHRPPLVVTLHNVMTRKFASVLPVLGKLLREADWVTGVSQAVAEDVLTYEPAVASRLSVITNGIVPPLLDMSPVPDGPARLSCIGRLDPQKGFDLAVTAFAGVRERHASVRLVVAGDGPERGRLTSLARELGVADGVEFLGFVDREGIARVLRESTVVLIPSRFEGLPLVALEAAWAGRPVVAAEAPGLSEAVLRDETALVVPVEDPDALAAAIGELLADPPRAKTMGWRARALAERRYSLDPCVDAYEQLYGRVVGSALASVPAR